MSDHHIICSGNVMNHLTPCCSINTWLTVYSWQCNECSRCMCLHNTQLSIQVIQLRTSVYYVTPIRRFMFTIIRGLHKLNTLMDDLLLSQAMLYYACIIEYSLFTHMWSRFDSEEYHQLNSSQRTPQI